MPGKHFYVGLLMILFLYVLGFVQSCCPNSDYHIYSIELVSREKILSSDEDSIYVDIGELGRPFKLMIIYETIDLAANSLVVSTSHARSCPPPESQNNIDLMSLTLKMNRSFEFNGKLVSELTNLLEIPKSGIKLNSSISSSNYVFIDFEFTQRFFDQSSFEPGDYTFYVTGKTSDNIPLAADITLTVNE